LKRCKLFFVFGIGGGGGGGGRWRKEIFKKKSVDYCMSFFPQSSATIKSV
jgi:hypothetical protein